MKDWAGNIGTHSVVVTVTEAFPTLTIAAIILVVFIAIAAILVIRRQRSQRR
ncbi:MAG: hypothetical protein QXO02_07325 [Thermofilaceae archaeon]